MTGLVGFANAGGKGLTLPKDIFAWQEGGAQGALDLHDYAMAGDVGYFPDWVNNTRAFLDNPVNSHVNVIIWSWCGQVADKFGAAKLSSEYLLPMSQLEADYPRVTFVYMTGHLNHWDDTATKQANQAIRDYCIAKARGGRRAARRCQRRTRHREPPPAGAGAPASVRRLLGDLGLPCQAHRPWSTRNWTSPAADSRHKASTPTHSPDW